MNQLNQAGEPVVCENYEITFGADGQGVVLSFDLDDLPAKDLAYAQSLALTPEAFVVQLAQSDASDAPVALEVHFPVGPADGQLKVVADSIRKEYLTVYVAALGADANGESKIVFSRELTLA